MRHIMDFLLGFGMFVGALGLVAAVVLALAFLERKFGGTVSGIALLLLFACAVGFAVMAARW